MKKHRYRITLERISDSPEVEDAGTLQFEAGNHDDIFAIIARIRSKGQLDADAAAAFGLGMKLFGETLLDNRNTPPFDALVPHFGQFMKTLKGDNR